MGGAQAAKTLLELEVEKLKREGKEPSDEELKELYESDRATKEIIDMAKKTGNKLHYDGNTKKAKVRLNK